jgi:hypothetical protein
MPGTSTGKKRKILQRFFQHAPSAKQAYTLRERLTAIFEMSLSQKQAQAKLRRWIQQVRESGLHCFDRFLKLLDTWWQEITNYFIQRETSAFVERSTTRSKSSSVAVMAFSTSSTSFNGSISTCMAIAYLLPPPYLAESRQFPESH